MSSAKVAEFSMLTGALFAIIIAADLKKGSNTMFAMVSSCPK
jgi:hypothetical protein